MHRDTITTIITTVTATAPGLGIIMRRLRAGPCNGRHRTSRRRRPSTIIASPISIWSRWPSSRVSRNQRSGEFPAAGADSLRGNRRRRHQTGDAARRDRGGHRCRRADAATRRRRHALRPIAGAHGDAPAAAEVRLLRRQRSARADAGRGEGVEGILSDGRRRRKKSPPVFAGGLTGSQRTLAYFSN